MSLFAHVVMLLPTWSSLGPFRLDGAGRLQAATVPPVARVDAVLKRSIALEPARGPDEPRSETAVRTPIRQAAQGSAASEPWVRLSRDMPAPPDKGAGHENEREVPAPAARALPLPQYFPPEQLTRQPVLLDDLEDALREPLEAGFRGRLVIRLFIDAAGKVDGVRVLETTMPTEVEGLVVKAFYVARYRPGEIEGQAVKSEMTMEVGVSTMEGRPLRLPSRGDIGQERQLGNKAQSLP